jgi:hypothetical protein
MNHNKYDDAIFNKASDEAMAQAKLKTAEQRLKLMGPGMYEQIISKLREDCANSAIVTQLEKEVNSSTDKNQTILNVMQKSGDVAKAIMGILGLR